MSTILLIQDEELNQDRLSRRLMKKGYFVQTQSEIEAALKWVKERRPDLILLDMDLTDMDGWKAAKVFQETEETKGVPIIAMANDAVDGAEAIALDAGCAAFVHLPVDFDDLMSKVQPLLAGQPSQ